MMTLSAQLQDGIREIGIALRRPEAFAVRWRERRHGEQAPQPVVFPLLAINAILGFAVYGLIVGLHAGALTMLKQAVLCASCGLAWFIALPALYIINSALGSRLDMSTTVLAALVTISFGALAMLASVPVGWFFAITLPTGVVGLQLAVHVVIFAGISFCMVDVFLRVMRALEPNRDQSYALVWLLLVGVIGTELMNLLNAGPFALIH